MKPEIEAKFLGVDHSALRRTLKKVGAKCVSPMRQMTRKNYDYPNMHLEQHGGWVRLRDEGDKVTLAYKQLNDRTLHGTHEVSVVVDSFDKTVAFLLAIGLVETSHQETRRESWELDGCQVELDEWPWVKPTLEIEGINKASVQAAAKKLGMVWANACFGSIEIAYMAEYEVTEAEINHILVFEFDQATPEWLEKRRK